ncbi:MAG: hypothetical protein HC778_03895 [Chamaesiphon sp. CSU_1_12]|nr:hypothetical protein [Chamaesiphon sp. CSU_1_12]
MKTILSISLKVRSFIVSSKNNTLKENELSLIRREQNATYLKKYSDKLIEQRKRVDPIFEELADACRNSLNRIIDRTDDYSQPINYRNSTATRHLVYKIIGNLFNVFSYEMTWQTTKNLYYRFRQIVDLQQDYKKFDTKKKTIDIQNLYEKQNCCNLEGKLFNTKEFVDLLSGFLTELLLTRIYTKVY